MSEVFSIVCICHLFSLFYTYFSLVAMSKLQRNISLNCKGFYVWLCYGRYFLQQRITTNWSLRKVIAFVYEEWRSLILSLATSTKAWPYKMSSGTIFSRQLDWYNATIPLALWCFITSIRMLQQGYCFCLRRVKTSNISFAP